MIEDPKIQTEVFPETQILPRTNWRHSKNNEAMEKARKRLNSYAATRTIGMGGAYIKYPNIYRDHINFVLG
jgi:hypothetical protein